MSVCLSVYSIHKDENITMVKDPESKGPVEHLSGRGCGESLSGDAPTDQQIQIKRWILLFDPFLTPSDLFLFAFIFSPP